ncbi:MAG TPA: transposase, partial [Sphaerochaeta sp.]|nr:transposase [Sphaerochaeta sp.]
MNITDFRYHGQLSFSMNHSIPLELFPTERAIIMLLQKMDYRWFEAELEKKVSGRPRVVDYYTMMVIVIYGKTQGKYSCREIAALCRRDVFLLAILDGTDPPSYVTINRFLKK